MCPFKLDHLKKEDLAKEFPKNREIKSYTSEMRKWLLQAMKLRKAGLSETKYRAEAEKIKQKILKLSGRQARHPAVRGWQDFYVEKADRL